MKTFVFETKEKVWLLCKDICLAHRSFYKDSIDIIEQNGATIIVYYSFLCNGKHIKHPDLNKRCVLVICSSIYPATNSKSYAERTYTCQYYYSKVGVIKKTKESTFRVSVNTREDKCMTHFFKRYAKRLTKKAADLALKHKLSDVVANLIIPKRQGSSFNKEYRGFPIKVIIAVIILIILFLFRLAIPTGYHPSLK